LSARFYENKKEDNVVSIKSRTTKKLITVLVAAALILSLSTVVAFAYGSQIIQLLGGGQIVSERTGNSLTVSMTTYEAEPDPVEVIDDRVYFIMDDSNTDITDYCTETTYFRYERIADNGYRHVFIVGGAPDNLGWAEFVWDENGDHFVSSTRYPSSVDDIDTDQPQWLELAYEELGIYRAR